MEHRKIRPQPQRCPMPDLDAYEAGAASALNGALELRGLLENHLGPRSEAVNAFGHDINNAVAGLNSAVQLAVNNAPPLYVVNTLLSDYPARVDKALHAIRDHVSDETVLQKIDTLQQTMQMLFSRLQCARESYAEQHTGHPYAEISNIKTLGIVGPEGQKGIWV